MVSSVLRCGVAFVLACCVSPFCAGVKAQSVEQFYKNNDIHLLIGSSVGGGYDTYGRFFARYLPEFLPGARQVIVQNMPGAAGIKMANNVFHQSPKDGTVIGTGSGSIAIAALFGSAGARYDARQFLWIGSLNSEVGLTVSWHTSPVRTTADLFTKELIIGAAGNTDGNAIYPRTMNKVLGTKFKIIAGYKGSADIAIALERGEIQGVGSWHYSSILATRPNWLKENDLNVLLQLALQRHPAQPNVPTVLELARTDEERAVIELVFAQQDMGRPVFGPPGMPADRAEALQSAFTAMVTDRNVLKEAEKIHLEINQPMSGKDMYALIGRLYEEPAAAVKRASEAMQYTQEK
jgi:tripartite-type tricarboxylate transporter receptor subunit TctC